MKALPLVAFLAACGAPPRTTEPAPTPAGPDAPSALDDVAWIVGDWFLEDESGGEFWTPAPGVLWGIGLHNTSFEVMVIDTGGDGGALRFTPAPDGVRTDSFTRPATDRDPTSVTFTNPAHDDPTSIRYVHESGAGRAPERLIPTLDGPGGLRQFPMTAVSDAPPAPPVVLAAADDLTRWSRRSLTDGSLAATLTIKGETSYIKILRGDPAGNWATIYEDHRP